MHTEMQKLGAEKNSADKYYKAYMHLEKGSTAGENIAHVVIPQTGASSS